MMILCLLNLHDTYFTFERMQNHERDKDLRKNFIFTKNAQMYADDLSD